MKKHPIQGKELKPIVTSISGTMKIVVKGKGWTKLEDVKSGDVVKTKEGWVEYK